MVRRRSSKITRRIRQCAQDGLLLFTDHARREMNSDLFGEADVLCALQKGACVARQTHGGRGTRFLFRGRSVDGRSLEVVCRIAPGGVRVVTVYRI